MKWTNEEARRYRQVEDSELSLLYERARISANPEERESYLRNFLGIPLDSEEEALITSFSGKNDSISRLKILENMAVSELIEQRTH